MSIERDDALRKRRAVAATRRWQLKNAEKRSAIDRAYRARHGARLNAEQRRRRLEHPEYAESAAARKRERRDVYNASRRLALRTDAERRAAKARQNRDWKDRNRDSVREAGRRTMRARRLGRDPDAVAYADVLLRDPCSYCGASTATVDHIDPVARGGRNEWTNLTGACLSCNSRKHTEPLLGFLLKELTDAARE
jgi:5-methylcytosine-specific restriction endonuclease McrA